MLQSNLFNKTFKNAPKEEEAVNARLLTRAGFIEKAMAGVYNFLPLGLKVLQNIKQIVREEMEKVGGQEILMSGLQPKANWRQTGRWETYDALFKFTSYYSQIDYALGPTHEEIISPLAKKYINSYKDLPTYLFQIQDKFRDEKRAKSGILRGREFSMKDLYSFHTHKADLDRYYEKVIQSYRKIFNRLGLGDFTYLTLAPGGTFSKYSHEFQSISEAGEDNIHICKNCNMAINNDIIEEMEKCPECGGKDFRQEKSIEVANIFKLGNKYSEPFDLKYKDKDENDYPVIMGCYGIGITRVMGAITEIYHDKKGLVWPESVAPYQIHLVYIPSREKNSEVKPMADKVYQKLLNKGKEVLYDDRSEIKAGEKLVESDLLGIPTRIVISENTVEKQSAEVKKREEEETKLVGFSELSKI